MRAGTVLQRALLAGMWKGGMTAGARDHDAQSVNQGQEASISRRWPIPQRPNYHGSQK